MSHRGADYAVCHRGAAIGGHRGAIWQWLQGPVYAVSHRGAAIGGHRGALWSVAVAALIYAVAQGGAAKNADDEIIAGRWAPALFAICPCGKWAC